MFYQWVQAAGSVQTKRRAFPVFSNKFTDDRLLNSMSKFAKMQVQ